MTNRTFDDIENANLRTWNRCATAFNLAEDKGTEASEKYMEEFGPRDKKQMLIMFERIKSLGYEDVKRAIMRGDYDREE